MNERLRELYRQAHSIRHYDGDPMRDGNPPTIYWQDEVSAERFAELIVRDVLNICYDIARPQYNGDDHKFTPGAKAVDKLVRKFYGVEE